MATKYWVGGGSSTNWNATSNTNWSDTSGGANNATVPATGDDVVFDANSGTGTSVINTAFSLNSLDTQGFTGTLTHNNSVTVTITGNDSTAPGGVTLRIGSGTTFNNGGTAATFDLTSTSGTVTVTANSSGSSRNVGRIQFNGAATFSLGSALSTRVDGTFSHTAGTLQTNNVAISCGFLSVSGSTSRTFTPGSSTFTITGLTGTCIGGNPLSNFTQTSNTATYNLVATATGARNISILNNGGSAWGTISVSNASPNGFPIIMTGSTAFTSTALTFTNVQHLELPAGVTLTTDTFTLSGSQSNPAVIVAPNTQCTLALTNNYNPQWVALNGLNRSGGTITATNCWNCGNNNTGANFTISAPATGTKQVGG